MRFDRARPIRVLELRSVRGSGGGPEKTILLGSARSDPARVSVTVCYLRDERDSAFRVTATARDLGLDYVELREKHSFDLHMWSRLATLVRDRNIDIVHAHDYKTDALALWLARRTAIIPLATVHGWIWNTWREQIYNTLDRRVLARFPAVIAVSRRIRRTLIDGGASPELVHHVPNGVDHRQYRKNVDARNAIRRELGLPADALVIGAVGRLSSEKRFDLLLMACAQITRGTPHVLLVGDGPARAALEAQAAAVGLSGRACFTGIRSDVANVLQALDVYVQSSDTEGVPNAVLEAMASEVPVVATDVGGTGELIDHDVHGRLVPPGHADLIAHTVDRAIADANATRRMTRAARERIERELSFDARMGRVEAVYGELVYRFRRMGVA